MFGAEVAKVLGCDISAVDEAVVFKILLALPKLEESDIQLCRTQGQVYTDTVINKSAK
ncbi:conjugal transfer protein TraD [Citrobacter sp. wls757]|uniref:conjugal transfer protein TraD n=1 Tax=Citrobacter sp. wls757 TaxID=2576417 RepID=UPI0032C3D8A6